jgi:hypothetical protein
MDIFFRMKSINALKLIGLLFLIPRHFGQQETHSTPIGGSGKDQSATDKAA